MSIYCAYLNNIDKAADRQKQPGNHEGGGDKIK